MDKIIYTYRQLARRFGVSVPCISGIVKARRIKTTRHPTNGNGYAVDVEGMREIEEALTASPVAAGSPS